MGAQQPLANVGDVGLDLALGLGPVGLAEPQREAVVMRRRQPPRMKHVLAQAPFATDVGADDGLGTVIEQLAWDAAEVPERCPVAGPERDEVLGAGQRAERVPGVARDHVKDGMSRALSGGGCRDLLSSGAQGVPVINRGA